MEKNVWQLQVAKNRFSSLVEKAQADGPQIVTKRGINAVVILSYDEYEKIIRSERDLVTFFQESPLRDEPLGLSRNKDLPRDVEL